MCKAFYSKTSPVTVWKGGFIGWNLAENFAAIKPVAKLSCKNSSVKKFVL